MQHRLQHRQQMPLRNRLHAAHYLPLRYRIHRVDVINSGPSVVLSLMHCIHTQVPRPAPRLWLAALGNTDFAGSGRLHLNPNLSVRFRTPQIVQMRHRDAGQLLVFLLAKHFIFASQYPPHRWS